MKIISRSEWQAKPPKAVHRMSTAPLGWIVHWNGPAMSNPDGAAIMRGVQRYHQVTKGWLDFAYSFGIDQKGNVYEGRGWLVNGGHTSGRYKGQASQPYNNKAAMAVFFMIGEGQTPTPAALASFKALVWEGEKHGVARRVTAHKDASPSLGTSCPGPDLTALCRDDSFVDVPDELELRIARIEAGVDAFLDAYLNPLM